MRERSLGKTKIPFSELTLGTWGLADGPYGDVDQGTFEETIAKALELGVLSFDMAPLWGNGMSEHVVARTVGDRAAECIYTTRVGQGGRPPSITSFFDADSLWSSCEKSLDRLDRDWIDLVLLHNPGEATLREGEATKAMREMVGEKMIGAWGVSVSTLDEATAAIDEGADALCLPFNLLQPDLFYDLVHRIREERVGVLVRSPLLHGLLARPLDSTITFEDEADHRRSRWTETALRRREEHARALRFVAGEDATSLLDTALRYVLAHDAVTSVALGARSSEQLEAAVGAMGTPPYLADEHLERIPQILAAVGA